LASRRIEGSASSPRRQVRKFKAGEHRPPPPRNNLGKGSVNRLRRAGRAQCDRGIAEQFRIKIERGVPAHEAHPKVVIGVGQAC